MKRGKSSPHVAEIQEGHRLLLRVSADDLTTLRERVDAFLAELPLRVPRAPAKRARSGRSRQRGLRRYVGDLSGEDQTAEGTAK